jgi:hypothetical protein
MIKLNLVLDPQLSLIINHKETLKLLKRPDNFASSRSLYSEVVFNYLTTLIDPISNKKNVSNFIRYGIYLDYMIKFLSLPKIIKQSPENISINNNIEIDIVKYLIDNFTQNSFELNETIKYVKTPVLQHKLIFFIIVLTLILNNFRTDMGVLSRSMKIDNKQMFQYCREIGCNFPGIKNEIVEEKKIKNVKNLVMELKAPLRVNIEREIKRFTKN